MRALLIALSAVSLLGCEAPATTLQLQTSPTGSTGGGGMGGGPGGGMGGGFAGIGGGIGGGVSLPPALTPLPPGPGFSSGPLQSTPLAPLPGRRAVLAALPEADALYVVGDTGTVRIPLPAGARPSSVAVVPDGQRAWVALRGLGRVARVRLDEGRVDVSLDVGAEPTGLALSPNGTRAVVCTFGERSVAVVNTDTFEVTHVDVGGHPRAVAITNDSDLDDADEVAWVTLFYGEPLAEVSDVGRVGKLLELSLSSSAVTRQVSLAPLSIGTGFCAPNQLYAVTLAQDRAFVSHVCAAPELPLQPYAMAYTAVSVVDLTTGAEVPWPAGSRVVDHLMVPSLAGVPVALAPSTTPGFPVALLSQGGNNVTLMGEGPGIAQQLFLSAGSGGTSPYGMPPPPTPDVAGDSAVDGVPTGVFVSGREVLVLDDTGRRVTVLDLGGGRASARFELPPLGEALERRLGQKFFATALGRWSQRDRLACVTCHPDGLSDNLTWAFPAGPRQTPPLDGTFAKGDPTDHRAQNWTALFDEISDVEGVIRTMAGGLGAITELGPMSAEVPVSLTAPRQAPGGRWTRNDGLSGSTTELVDSVSVVKDWREVEAWLRQVHTPAAPTRLDAAAVARGRLLFEAGGCHFCHGGPKWTVSRVPYSPSVVKNGSAVGEAGQEPRVPWGLRTSPRLALALWKPGLNTDTLKVAPETLPDNTVVGPERITCVLRDVGTFDATSPLERKANGQVAQGTRGFNPPSLLGLATTAPYFHHGAARTLENVFHPRFAAHTSARVPDFLAAPQPGQVEDLVAFLESIDETTTPFPLPLGADICGEY
ncbi:MAG: hypothetical protein AB1938_26595 [Myxococcota bacterium]